LIGIEIINELAGWLLQHPLPFPSLSYVSRREVWNPFLSRQQQQQQIIIIITKWHDDDITFRSSYTAQLNGEDMEKEQEISTVVAVVCGQPGSVFVHVLLTLSTVLPASFTLSNTTSQQ
jgi:hypothetical protein